MGSAGRSNARGGGQLTTVTATRSELLARRSREGIAQRGHALRFPRHELTRIRQRHLDRHHSPAKPGDGHAR